MKNEKKELLIGAVGLVKGNVRNDCQAMIEISKMLEPEFESTGFLDDAPFDVVSLILRYGETWGGVKVERINRHKEVEVAVELPMAEVRSMDFDSLSKTVMIATLQSLVEVGDKYDLPRDRWCDLLARIEST